MIISPQDPRVLTHTRAFEVMCWGSNLFYLKIKDIQIMGWGEFWLYQCHWLCQTSGSSPLECSALLCPSQHTSFLRVKGDLPSWQAPHCTVISWGIICFTSTFQLRAVIQYGYWARGIPFVSSPLQVPVHSQTYRMYWMGPSEFPNAELYKH